MNEGERTALRRHFEQEGYVILRGLIEQDAVREAREALEIVVNRLIDRLIEGGELTDPLERLPLETRLYRLLEKKLELAPSLFREELHLEGFYGIFFHHALLDTVQMFLGDEIRLYPNYSVRPKLPDFEAARVLWHQDGGYTKIVAEDGDEVGQLRMVNAWSPLVPATVANGCMQFIPGTHKLGVVPHVRKDYYLEIDDAALFPLLEHAIDIELNPGDVVLFHNLLFHQGLPNRSDHIRWSLDWRYQDAMQGTQRPQQGHLARSRLHPERVVRSKREWAERSFV